MNEFLFTYKNIYTYDIYIRPNILIKFIPVTVYRTINTVKKSLKKNLVLDKNNEIKKIK